MRNVPVDVLYKVPPGEKSFWGFTLILDAKKN
jgi:hypothetical protein